jgi:hypothetical protein
MSFLQLFQSKYLDCFKHIDNIDGDFNKLKLKHVIMILKQMNKKEECNEYNDVVTDSLYCQPIIFVHNQLMPSEIIYYLIQQVYNITNLSHYSIKLYNINLYHELDLGKKGYATSIPIESTKNNETKKIGGKGIGGIGAGTGTGTGTKTKTKTKIKNKINDTGDAKNTIGKMELEYIMTIKQCEYFKEIDFQSYVNSDKMIHYIVKYLIKEISNTSKKSLLKINKITHIDASASASASASTGANDKDNNIHKKEIKDKCPIYILRNIDKVSKCLMSQFKTLILTANRHNVELIFDSQISEGNIIPIKSCCISYTYRQFNETNIISIYKKMYSMLYVNLRSKTMLTNDEILNFYRKGNNDFYTFLMLLDTIHERQIEIFEKGFCYEQIIWNLIDYMKTEKIYRDVIVNIKKISAILVQNNLSFKCLVKTTLLYWHKCKDKSKDKCKDKSKNQYNDEIKRSIYIISSNLEVKLDKYNILLIYELFFIKLFKVLSLIYS